MKTKLVYVLTSDPDKTFIEQALMSIYTARYYNPDATIMLLTDDKTDKLFTGSRAEILEYISEKVVVEFSEDVNMMLRSRKLKTSIRKHVKGDFLFIDCDTLVCRSLIDIDDCKSEIAAVLESHLKIKDFNTALYDKMADNANLLVWDPDKEERYFSSGVIYVKESERTKLLFDDWSRYWHKGLNNGVAIDQPSFAKANIENGRIIEELDGSWNCIMFTHPLFDREAKIMHFTAFGNRSYIFEESFLSYVRSNGIKSNRFVRDSILNPVSSYIPFDNAIHQYKVKDFARMNKVIRKTFKLLSENLPESLPDYIMNSTLEKKTKFWINKKMYGLAAAFITMYKFYYTKLSGKYKYKENVQGK